MQLAPDAALVRNYPWIPRLLWGLTVVFLVVAVVSTRWFRRNLGSLLGHDVQPDAKGRYFNQGAVSGSSFVAESMNIHMSGEKSASLPKIRMDYWPGILEAAAPELETERPGHILARLSNAVSETLEQSEFYRSGRQAWGKIETAHSNIPFKTVDDHQQSASIRLEMVTLHSELQCSKPFVDLDLNWNDKPKDVSFQIRAIRPGRYLADIVLSVEEKYISTVHLDGEAHIGEDATQGTSAKGGRYVELTMVQTTIITREIRRELTKEDPRQHESESGHRREQGYGPDISM